MGWAKRPGFWRVRGSRLRGVGVQNSVCLLRKGLGFWGSVGCRALGFKVLWIIGSFKACKASRLGRLRFDVRFCGASGFWALGLVS